jgi:hypothetical protein
MPHQAYDAEEPEQEAKAADTEGEQEMEALPPLEEKLEEPNVAAVSTGQITCANPEHLRQFEQLFGQRVFSPNVPGASMGVTGPDE